jgi:hypothetical protein
MSSAVCGSNQTLQATPGFAFLFIVAQVPGAPDADRSWNLLKYQYE